MKDRVFVHGKPFLTIAGIEEIFKRSDIYHFKVITSTDEACQIDFFYGPEDNQAKLGHWTALLDMIPDRPVLKAHPKQALYAIALRQGTFEHFVKNFIWISEADL